ncbi:MAG: hypothetical protein RXR43_05495 [Sulfolobus sp.]
MIRIGLLLLSIGLTLIFLNSVSINSSSSMVINFVKQNVTVPSFVNSATITVVQNKSSVKTVVEVIYANKTYNLTLPVTLYIKGGESVFIFVINETNKTTMVKPFLNVTAFIKISNARAFVKSSQVEIEGILLSIVGALLQIWDLVRGLIKK